MIRRRQERRPRRIRRLGQRVAVSVGAPDRRSRAPCHVVVLRIEAADGAVGHGGETHGEEPRGLDYVEPVVRCRVPQRAPKHEEVLTGPEPRRVVVVRRPTRAGAAAPVARLGPIGGVLERRQRQGSVGTELVAPAHGPGLHEADIRPLRNGSGRERLEHAGARCRLYPSGRACSRARLEIIARAHGEQLLSHSLADRGAIELRLPVRDARHVARILTVERALLGGETFMQNPIGGGCDRRRHVGAGGRNHRRGVRLVSALDRDHGVVHGDWNHRAVGVLS